MKLDTSFTIITVLTITVLMGLSFNEVFNRPTSLKSDIAKSMSQGQ